MTANHKGSLFDRLVEIMATLRSPAGCPWDRAQDSTSLKPFLLEEAYEVLEAIEEGTPHKLKDELGDLLFQVIFHAQLARERGDFDVYDVLAGTIAKMTRRHPLRLGRRVNTQGSAAELGGDQARGKSGGAMDVRARRRASPIAIPVTRPAFAR